MRGKGYWGDSEGIEKLFALPAAAAAFVQNPLNFGRVQAVLDAVPAAEGVTVRDSSTLHNTGFSGAPASCPQPSVRQWNAELAAASDKISLEGMRSSLRATQFSSSMKH